MKVIDIIKELKDESTFDSLPNTDHISDEQRQELRTLLRRLLKPDVSQRESIEEIGKDKWFAPVKREGSYVVPRILTTGHKFFVFNKW